MAIAESESVLVRPAGDRALLLEPTGNAEAATLSRMLQQLNLPGVTDILPAAQTVLVTFDDQTDSTEMRRRLQQMAAEITHCSEAAEDSRGSVVRIPVVYNGEDLAEVATILGISVEDVVEEHCRRTWSCAFVGFAPGFGYLKSDEPGLTVPRRAESRTAVPPGSVALADGYSAIYPRRSPGGWQLIGRTTLPVWDTDSAQPALIRPGGLVRFEAEDIR